MTPTPATQPAAGQIEEPNILAKDVKVSIKVMMNREKTKVLFAEADTKFAEIILSFLKLPLGEIVSVFKRHYADEKPVIGSLDTLYTGLLNLDDGHFCTNGCKKMLLNPRSSFINKPVKHFRCGDNNCKNKNPPNVSLYYDSGTCDCGKPLNRVMGAIEPRSGAAGDGIFVEGLPFLVTDDLQLAPYEPGSVIQTLINLGIVVTDGAEQRNVTLGYNEIVNLLKGSLLSKTPLTDNILRVCNKNTDCVPDDLLDRMEPELEQISTNSKRMIVRALIQKSTNKLLYVTANGDFVDFLLSFLTIPLGGVESLLGSKTCFKSIDNLYNSTANLIKDNHLVRKDAKKRLREPELPPYYVSKKQIFPLSEQTTHPIYYSKSFTDFSGRMIEKGFWMHCKDPKGDEGCYVKQHGAFVISDDLTVTPSNVALRGIICNDMNIATSDLKEMEVKVGLKEGLNLLKASLASKSALSDGLINPMLKMQSR